MTDYIITYDVNTQTKEGRRRLRQVAQACASWGQRVQFSVFECSLNEMQMEALVERLAKIIDLKDDSLRVYRLAGGRHSAVKVFGRDKYVSFKDPLIA